MIFLKKSCFHHRFYNNFNIIIFIKLKILNLENIYITIVCHSFLMLCK